MYQAEFWVLGKDWLKNNISFNPWSLYFSERKRPFVDYVIKCVVDCNRETWLPDSPVVCLPNMCKVLGSEIMGCMISVVLRRFSEEVTFELNLIFRRIS